jgi:hypothetical protein
MENAGIKVELEAVAYAGNAAFFSIPYSMGSFLFVQTLFWRIRKKSLFFFS